MQTLFNSNEATRPKPKLTRKQKYGHALNRVRGRRTLDQFAELLAEGETPGNAAVKLGLQRGSGDGLLRKLRIGLGEQAI